MAIPAGVETVAVTDGGVPITGPDGTPLNGHLTVTGPDLATVKDDDFVFGGTARRWVSAGRFDPFTLVATDATGIDPTGFAYTIVFTPKYGTPWTRFFTLPLAVPSVVLADILIPDPVTGSYAVLVDPSTVGGGTDGALPLTGGKVTGHLAVTGNALGEDKPSVHGLAAWCYDPALAVNSTELTGGRLYLVRVDLAAAVTVTRVCWWVGNAGSSPVAGRNEVGLYAPDGSLLTAVNVDSAITSAGLKTTVVPGQELAAGSFCWVALLFNASVPPTLTRASGWTGVDAVANLGLAPAAYRFAWNGSGRTVLPATVSPAANVGTDFAGPWAAVAA